MVTVVSDQYKCHQVNQMLALFDIRVMKIISVTRVVRISRVIRIIRVITIIRY